MFCCSIILLTWNFNLNRGLNRFHWVTWTWPELPFTFFLLQTLKVSKFLFHLHSYQYSQQKNYNYSKKEREQSSSIFLFSFLHLDLVFWHFLFLALGNGLPFTFTLSLGFLWRFLTFLILVNKLLSCKVKHVVFLFSNFFLQRVVELRKLWVRKFLLWNALSPNPAYLKFHLPQDFLDTWSALRQLSYLSISRADYVKFQRKVSHRSSLWR